MPAERGPLLASSLSGLRAIGHVAALRRMTLLYVALLLGVNLVDAQFVVLLRGTSHAAEVLGLGMSLSGAGMAGAAALSMRRQSGHARVQISSYRHGGLHRVGGPAGLATCDSTRSGRGPGPGSRSCGVLHYLGDHAAAAGAGGVDGPLGIRARAVGRASAESKHQTK